MLKQVGLGLSLGLLVFFCGAGILAACGAPTLPQCQLSAVVALPLDDPDAVTVGDVRALVERLRACNTKGGDAGAR